jgi:hypothetical protein
VLGEHPDVVDEIGEERRHDAPVAGLDRDRSVIDGGSLGRSELGAALIAESCAPGRISSAGWALHDGSFPLQERPV